MFSQTFCPCHHLLVFFDIFGVTKFPFTIATQNLDKSHFKHQIRFRGLFPDIVAYWDTTERRTEVLDLNKGTSVFCQPTAIILSANNCYRSSMLYMYVEYTDLL
jgi:hypothetical protein